MKKNKIKYILSWIMYAIGFVMYVVFMELLNGISDTAWLYAMGASLGVLLFTLSGYLRQ